MLQVEYQEASSNHQWLVKQFETFHSNEPLLAEKFVPRPDISIIFHFKDKPQIIDKINTPLEPFFATSLVSKSLEMTVNGVMDSFVVICKPTVFSNVFNINLSRYSTYSIPLPTALFYPVWKELAQLDTFKARIDYFTTFIENIQKTPYINDAIDELYDKIVTQGTTDLLKDIMLENVFCKRTLERNFIKRTGVNPKTLMRIVRLDELLTPIKNGKIIDYQELVFNGNYCDQAHFIKDFKSVINETPTHFFKRNLQHLKLFSGRQEKSL